jgi:GNAT superfamily N-acetyltransferase
VSYRFPVLLDANHVLDGFSCASVEQTECLIRHARRSMASNSTRVLVVTPDGSRRVVAYAAWTMAQIAITDAPARLRKGAGRYPQPVALLARLGVDEEHTGRGLGAALLLDIIRRAAAIGAEIGCRGLLVHCESEAARSFYEHLVPEFERSPTDPLHLVLLMKDITRTLEDPGA